MFYSALPHSSVSSLDKMYHSPDDKVQLSSINFELHGRFLKKSCNIFFRWMTLLCMKTHGKVTLVPRNILDYYPIYVYLLKNVFWLFSVDTESSNNLSRNCIWRGFSNAWIFFPKFLIRRGDFMQNLWTVLYFVSLTKCLRAQQ